MSEEKVPQFTFEDDLPNDEQTSQPVEEQTVEEQSTPEVNDDVMAIYNVYKDNGLLSEREDFGGTFEDLHRAIIEDANQRQEQLVTQIFQSVPEFAQPLLQLALNKGNDLTREELQEIFQVTEPMGFSREDLNDEDKAVQFLKQVYMRDFEEDEEGAEERIDMLRDRNRVTKEAEKLFEKEEKLKSELVNTKVEEAKTAKQQREQMQQQFQQNFVENVSSLEWQDQRKQAVQEELFSGQFKQRVEHVMNNPKALARLIDFMSYYDGEDFDMSNYQKQAFSSSTKKVKDQVQKYWSGNRSKSANPDQMYEGLEDLKFDIN